jgi:CMP-N-acetylneuraminic acid synthetase
MSNKIAALIPARSGSQGLPNKNSTLLNGIPLLAYAINAAVDSNIFDNIYLSSDSEDYLALGKKFGATPILRPIELASNTASIYSVVKDFITKHQYYDYLCILYPTYPFRTGLSIRNFMNYFFQFSSHDSMIGLKIPKIHPYLIYEFNDNKNLIKPSFNPDVNLFFRRQDYPNIYYELCHWTAVLKTSSIDLVNAQLISSNTLGYVIPSFENTTDIDTPADLILANFFIADNKI